MVYDTYSLSAQTLRPQILIPIREKWYTSALLGTYIMRSTNNMLALMLQCKYSLAYNQTKCSWFLFVHITINRNSIKWKFSINQFICSGQNTLAISGYWRRFLKTQAAVSRARKLVSSAQHLSSFCHDNTELFDNVQCDGDQPPTFIHLTLSHLCFIYSLRRKQTLQNTH
jgi:hypothetical protein